MVLAVVGQMAGKRKRGAAQEIVAERRFRCAKGYTLLTTLTASGEVPLALTVYSYMPEQLKKAGQPIDWFFLGGRRSQASRHRRHPSRAAFPRAAAAVLRVRADEPKDTREPRFRRDQAMRSGIRPGMSLDLIDPGESSIVTRSGTACTTRSS